MIEVARRIATHAHAGQVDKAGAAYITHPERVAERVTAAGGADEAIAAAWLHDVLEDTTVTATALRTAGIPDEVVVAVEAITKMPDEAPEDYYARVRSNSLALTVKRADLEDNTDPARTARLDAATRERLAAKYARARHALGV